MVMDEDEDENEDADEDAMQRGDGGRWWNAEGGVPYCPAALDVRRASSPANLESQSIAGKKGE